MDSICVVSDVVNLILQKIHEMDAKLEQMNARIENVLMSVSDLKESYDQLMRLSVD